jgi:hypothetical protein
VIGGVTQTGAQVLDSKVFTASIASIDASANNTALSGFLFRRTVTGGAGANGVGVSASFKAPNSAGTSVFTGVVQGSLTDVTATSEQGAVELIPAYGGTVAAAGVRVPAQIASLVNGIDLIPAASNGYVSVAPYGSSSNTELRIRAKGTGDLSLYNPANGNQVWAVTSNSGLKAYSTDNTGTPGAATINKPAGRVAIAATASSVTVTNSLVSATSIVLATLQTTDGTLTSIKSVVPGAGSFVITGNAAATAAVNEDGREGTEVAHIPAKGRVFFFDANGAVLRLDDVREARWLVKKT